MEAVVAPATRMLRMLITKASPVPSAPNASTLASTSAERPVGTGGAPATSGPTTASWAVASRSWAADSDTPEWELPAMNRFWYGMATP